MQQTEFHKNLFTHAGRYWVTSQWLKYVKDVLNQNPRKFNYGVKIVNSVLYKGSRHMTDDLVMYHSITWKQYCHLAANLRGERTYPTNTKN